MQRGTDRAAPGGGVRPTVAVGCSAAKASRPRVRSKQQYQYQSHPPPSLDGAAERARLLAGAQAKEEVTRFVAGEEAEATLPDLPRSTIDSI